MADNPLLPNKEDQEPFRPFGHPIAGALGLSIFGIWKLLKMPGAPPLRMIFKARSLAENVGLIVFLGALASSALVPWLVWHSFIAVVLGYVGCTLLSLVLMMPPMVRDAMRNRPPRGTYWTGSEFRRDRSFPLGRDLSNR